MLQSISNFEPEFSELLMSSLMRFYKVKSEEISYKIFLIRFCIENFEIYKKENKLSRELTYLLPDFLLSELNLPVIDKNIIYKGQKFLLYIASENSISNILDDWAFRYTDTCTLNSVGETVLRNVLIKRDIEELFNKADKFTKCNKRDKMYPTYFKRNCLQILNSTYNINPEYVGRLPDIKYPFYHNDFAPTMDEKYERLTRVLYQKETKMTISEKSMEKYLIRHLDLIEEGLTPMKNQYVINGGRLDILARDKNNIYTIIELKVESDTDIIFQALHYMNEIKVRFNVDKVRMIVVSTTYTPAILNLLKEIGFIEIYIIETNNKTDWHLSKIA